MKRIPTTICIVILLAIAASCKKTAADDCAVIYDYILYTTLFNVTDCDGHDLFFGQYKKYDTSQLKVYTVFDNRRINIQFRCDSAMSERAGTPANMMTLGHLLDKTLYVELNGIVTDSIRAAYAIDKTPCTFTYRMTQAFVNGQPVNDIKNVIPVKQCP